MTMTLCLSGQSLAKRYLPCNTWRLEQDYPPRERWCRQWHLKYVFQNNHYFNLLWHRRNLHRDEPSTAE
jgi:hypothetical protein